ncbi:conserved hypothetical protein [Thiomonas sp. X19]|uniref:hypothetical protein n=1 Tax=Thiomonas sp. X19 TaxID=1050370 RepID=UPI000B74BAF4|nr:hypothetical protein [Thiomonas sp. X19]SCC92023.1 conserved hypothetical protein [Thiomonas sp. X19]
MRAGNKRVRVGATPRFVPEAPGAVLWSGDGGHCHTEELILPGETLYALGQFQSLDPPSTLPPDDLSETLRWQSWAWLAAGLRALGLAGAAMQG